MTETRKRLYRAYIDDRTTESGGIGLYCTDGFLSECGRYVLNDYAPLYNGAARVTCQHDMTDAWQETETLAKAYLADKVRRIGERLIRQADELIAAASQMEAAAS